MIKKLRMYVFLAIATVVSAGITRAEHPNVLLIVSEDNGPELGCYGDRYARTPHLDQLAEDGILFRQAFVPQAGCSQSRASFLTGLYPHQHGQFGLATRFPPQPLWWYVAADGTCSAAAKEMDFSFVCQRPRTATPTIR